MDQLDQVLHFHCEFAVLFTIRKEKASTWSNGRTSSEAKSREELLESFQDLKRGEDYSWWHRNKKGRYKDVDETMDNTSPFFTNIYLLVDDIPTSGSTIGWNARLAWLTVGMVVHSAPRHKPLDSKLVHNGNYSEILELMADSESEHNIFEYRKAQG
ncbi:hypothetical protein MTR67_051445 [Solanum verrucosum]|uniref:Uncharacterized protein n=1 Tax=Solanum verrucosum TaxID=315347 RepID=A0AAF0V3X0_SOLVR|nr:hypothetical protein MTR67_051445 [Solanum verrucosum]